MQVVFLEQRFYRLFGNLYIK